MVTKPSVARFASRGDGNTGSKHQQDTRSDTTRRPTVGTLTQVSDTPQPSVTLYWRPGCPFCSRLTAALRAEGVEYQAVNIWEDPDAAAFVRSVANGNETVPTVTVGSTSMVNPPIERIVELLQA